jgi:hypothetical protein
MLLSPYFPQLPCDLSMEFEQANKSVILPLNEIHVKVIENGNSTVRRSRLV